MSSKPELQLYRIEIHPNREFHSYVDRRSVLDYLNKFILLTISD